MLPLISEKEDMEQKKVILKLTGILVLITLGIMNFGVPGEIYAQGPFTVATESDSNATESNAQRKSFFDPKFHRYWTFMSDASEGIKYSYSADGTSWTASGTLATYKNSKFSVFYKQINYVPYVFIAAVSEGNIAELHVLRGVIGRDGISFESPISVGEQTSVSSGISSPAISIDRLDFIVIAYAIDMGPGSSLTESVQLKIVKSTVAANSSSLSFETAKKIGKSASPGELREIALINQEGGTMFLVANGISGNIIAYRFNATSQTWEEQNNSGVETDYSWFNFSGVSVNTIAIVNSTVYIGCNFKNLSGDPSATLVAYLDTTTYPPSWKALGGGLQGNAVHSLKAYNNYLYVGGEFESAGGLEGTKNIAAWDLVNQKWIALGNGLDNKVLALEVYESTIYAGGAFSGYLSKWDSSISSWININSTLNGEVRALATDPVTTTQIIVGGAFTEADGTPLTAYIARLSGNTWSAISSTDVPNGPVNAIAISSNSDKNIYIGGEFTSVGNISGTNHIAYNHLSTWSALSTSQELNGVVRSLAFNGNTLLIGGDFLEATIPAFHVARFIEGGSFFYPMDYSANANYTVRTIVVDSSVPYVGGDFSSFAGNPNINKVAKLDVMQWVGLGSFPKAAIEGEIHAMEFYQNELYIGGDFQNAGGIEAADYLARFDGANWNAVLQDSNSFTPINKTVRALMVVGEKLYIGGDFHTDQSSIGYEYNYLTSFKKDSSGSSWVSLGNVPLGGPVHTLAKGTGEGIFVGGKFDTTNDQNLKRDHVAYWDGTAWFSLGSGVFENTIEALVLVNGTLYAGGYQIKYDSPNHYHLARFVNNAWESIQTVNGRVRSLASNGINLYVGGDFNYPAQGFAIYDGTNWSNGALNLDGNVHSIRSFFDNTTQKLLIGGVFSSNEAYQNGAFVYTPGAAPSTSELCAGLDGSVEAFAVNRDGIYVGGAFAATGPGTFQSFLSQCKKAAAANVGAKSHFSSLSDKNGNLHMLYSSASNLMYRSLDFTTTPALWGTPYTLGADGIEDLSLSIDYNTSQLIAAWSTGSVIEFSRRKSDGWEAPIPIGSLSTRSYLNSTLHVVPLNALLFWTDAGSVYSYLMNSSTASDVNYPLKIQVVTPSGRPLPGVKVNNGINQSCITDGFGVCVFRVASEPSYPIEVSRDGFTITFQFMRGRLTDNTLEMLYLATPSLRSLSGTIKYSKAPNDPLPNATVDGGLLGTTTTGTNGEFIFNNVAWGTEYTIRPRMEGYIFNPEFISGIADGNPSHNPPLDFRALKKTYTLSGKVTVGGRGLASVKINGGKDLGTVISKEDGSFVFQNVPAHFEYKLRPSLTGYTFSPRSITGVMDGAKKDANFSAAKRRSYGGNLSLINVSSDGDLANEDSGSVSPGSGLLERSAFSISNDAKIIAFSSLATKLVDDDTNGKRDVFVRFNSAGITKCISVNENGNFGDADSGTPTENERAVSLNSSGTHVAFHSEASNLVPLDGNGTSDVFLYDLEAGTHTLISQSSEGYIGNARSSSPSINSDASMVVFTSEATTLVDDDLNGAADIFLRNTVAGTTSRISISSTGTEANGSSKFPSISGDGNLVVFMSDASNLVEADTNGFTDIFLRNISEATTIRISQSSNGEEANGNSSMPAISADGKFIAFSSNATNLSSKCVNGLRNIFVYNVATHAINCVSISSTGNSGNADSGFGELSLSQYGRYVAFSSDANNLVQNDSNGKRDVFVHDLDTARTTLVSKSLRGTYGNNASGPGLLSADGETVVFTSKASNLTTNIDNGKANIFKASVGAFPDIYEAGIKIEDPPSVLRDNHTIYVVLAHFSLQQTSPSFYRLVLDKNPSRYNNLTSQTYAASKGKKVVYVIKIKGTKNTSYLKKSIVKKNQISYKNLKSGTYSLSYHVELREGTKVISKTKESPKRQFTVI
ncbi:MAG: hypothetical protein GYA55_14465 [SAR324 cluster bacterium]|uniref:Uncharacterized protein n=1 Tax=SAR324 cluster bacterium TaxID=2024889 RepID=A0A7X9ILN7_9DELT|nr:hypothetical protein [SAR324 cluster bacterium]